MQCLRAVAARCQRLASCNWPLLSLSLSSKTSPNVQPTPEAERRIDEGRITRQRGISLQGMGALLAALLGGMRQSQRKTKVQEGNGSIRCPGG